MASQAMAEDDRPAASELETVADLVFLRLPLGIQALAVPALSKQWKAWA